MSVTETMQKLPRYDGGTFDVTFAVDRRARTGTRRRLVGLRRHPRPARDDGALRGPRLRRRRTGDVFAHRSRPARSVRGRADPSARPARRLRLRLRHGRRESDDGGAARAPRLHRRRRGRWAIVSAANSPIAPRSNSARRQRSPFTASASANTSRDAGKVQRADEPPLRRQRSLRPERRNRCDQGGARHADRTSGSTSTTAPSHGFAQSDSAAYDAAIASARRGAHADDARAHRVAG